MMKKSNAIIAIAAALSMSAYAENQVIVASIYENMGCTGAPLKDVHINNGQCYSLADLHSNPDIAPVFLYLDTTFNETNVSFMVNCGSDHIAATAYIGTDCKNAIGSPSIIAHDECLLMYKFSCRAVEPPAEPTVTPTPTPKPELELEPGQKVTYPPTSGAKKAGTSGTAASPSTLANPGDDSGIIFSAATATQATILGVMGVLALLMI
jgi:hypothetical protein